MAVREKINRVKLEGWRVSRVPVDPAETIYQGDLLVWSSGSHIATKPTATSGWVDAASFVGMAEKSNPVETAGSTSFLSNPTSALMNVLQFGLVEVIMEEAVTVYPFDNVIMGADAQSVRKTGATNSNRCGIVDPAYGASGKACSAGDLIRIWLKVPDNQRVF